MADDFLNYAFDYWLKKGYAPHQAAALAGNAVIESNGNPGAIGDNGTAKGVYQWRLDRQQRLNQSPDAKSVPGQLDFADWELNNTEKGAGDALRNAKSYDEANNAVLGYLRPRNYTPQNPMASEAFVPRYNAGAGLLNMPPMAQALAMPPTRQVGGAGMVPADVVAATTPPKDVRTDDDRDMVGYNGSPRLPDATAGKPFDFLGFASRGLATAAAGEGQAPPQPAWIQQAMNAQGQVHRPQAQGLLTDILEDPEDKKRRLMAGLLGA